MRSIILVVIAAISLGRSYAQTRSIQLHAGSHDQTDVIVRVKHAGLSPKKSYAIKLDGKMIPAQVTNDSSLAFFFAGSIGAGETKTGQLLETKAKAKATVQINSSNGKLTVTDGQKALLVYHTAVVMPPADSPDYYKRSGFIHPVYSPNGEILTDDFPAGHVHQHALFAAWTNTTFKNSLIDFWNQHSKKGTVEHIKIIDISEGPVCAQLRTLLRYKSNAFGEVLQEKWTITVYPRGDHYIFDIESEQTNTSADTLYINKYHYGGMAFRGSKYWNPDDKKNYRNNWNILTSEGIKDSAANHTHAKWVDASGKVDKATAGITVFTHPSNFRYPQPIRVHPTMPYWVYAPMVHGAFTIDPGAKYFSKFRYYVHNGMPDTKFIEKLREDYAEEMKVTIK
jgi:hypothetical protein